MNGIFVITGDIDIFYNLKKVTQLPALKDIDNDMIL
jgi:hypothetical protein